MAGNPFLDAQVGRGVPGGCDDCNAEQVLTVDPVMPGLYRLEVRHDDTCPWLRRHHPRKGKR